MPEPPLDFIRRNATLFARVGSVVATYRTRGNTRFGPYYRLIYRQDRRQRALYLGPSEERAARQLLTELQRPRDERVAIRRSHRLRKATLLQLKREWQHVARAYGLRPHGWGVRGLRALGWPRIDKTTPPRRANPATQRDFQTCAQTVQKSQTKTLKRLPYCIRTLQQPAAGGSLDSSAGGLPSEQTVSQNRRCCSSNKKASGLLKKGTGSEQEELKPEKYVSSRGACPLSQWAARGLSPYRSVLRRKNSSRPEGPGETIPPTHAPRYCPNGPRAAQLALATMPSRSSHPIPARGPPSYNTNNGHSIIPSFHHSTIPSFHHSTIPPFHHSIACP